ncbi:hypothetical protein DFQ26_004989 [Actinomortierella ambigua]|nr:hypothetical protein DFQ26_004989 [Actinomortierella ambigua]
MPGRGGPPPHQQQYGQYGGNQGYGQQYGGPSGYGGYGQQQQQQQYGNFQQQQGYYGQQQQNPQGQFQQQPGRQYQQQPQQQFNHYQPPQQQQQQHEPSSYSSRPTNRNPGMRPPNLQPAQSSYGSNKTALNSNGSTSSGRTPTASSFPQQQGRQQQSLRTNRGFASPEPSPTGKGQGQEQQQPQAPSSGNSSTGYGTSLWNKMLAAKEVINATITGEERWADSDDSDHEGESHVARVLREYVEKKEDAAMAEQIAQMELSMSQQQHQQQQYSGGVSNGSVGSTTKNQSLRDALRKDHSSFTSNSSGDDHYSRSLRSRGMDDRDSNQSGNNSSGGGINLMNRFRAASDASRNDALNKLEGRGQGDALQAQISHLGSTSPRGQRGGGGGGGGGGLSPSAAGGDRYGATSPSNMSYSSSSNSLREAYQNRNRSNTTQHQQHGSGGRYF